MKTYRKPMKTYRKPMKTYRKPKKTCRKPMKTYRTLLKDPGVGVETRSFARGTSGRAARGSEHHGRGSEARPESLEFSESGLPRGPRDPLRS